VEGQHGRDTVGNEGAFGIVGLGGYPQTAPYHQEEEEQGQRRADEAQFVGNHGEDEISVAHLQEN